MVFLRWENKGSGGSILLLVLWALVFLGVLAMLSGRIARQQIILSDNIEKRTELYSLVSSGAMIMLDAVVDSEGRDVYSEKDLLKRLAAKEPSFSGLVRLGNGSFWMGEKGKDHGKGRELRQSGLVDEGGKINVNFADADTLARIFMTPGGMDHSSARQLAGNVIDWRDKDDAVYGGKNISGESSMYSRKGYGYVPRNRPLVCVEELLLVDGMTPEVFLKVRDHVTVFGTGTVNINTASAEVFSALGLSRELADKIVFFRKGRDPLEDKAEINIFRVPEDLMEAIKGRGGEEDREQDLREVDNLLFSGKVGTRAEVFSFSCAGKLDRVGPEGRLLCAFDRSGRLLYWGYFMSGRGIWR